MAVWSTFQAEELRRRVQEEEVSRMSVIRNIMYLGVGVASLTREKVEQAVDDLVKRGEVASADRAKAIEELHQKAQSAAAEIRKIVDERLDSVGRRLRWSEQMEKLQAEVERLNSRIDELEKKSKKSAGAAGKSAGGPSKS
jgi:polyhydroxyalkanoate synthesis regulator phasin